ncbi:MAG TPA: hypothetical protein VN764_15540, partial [Polyangiaceae bacterium]|nr:hypothetical protein [Polyangiaceae bacterium]
IPAQCYTKSDGTSNPCWVCHTDSHPPNSMTDFRLQAEYAFSEEGQKNHWTNLFVDRRAKMQQMSDSYVLSYIRGDNYARLREVMRDRTDFPGYVPDLDFNLGFDELGFAKDGSGWRAFRYKPFPGTFWPTNGSTDDVLIRLGPMFRKKAGALSLAIYRANLVLLEVSLTSDPSVSDEHLRAHIEPLDETLLEVDLNQDGRLETAVTELVGLPSHFVGDASGVRLWRALYPAETEFLHSVRYIDPDEPSMIGKRMKELRYMKKFRALEPSQLMGVYEHEHDEKDAGRLPVVQGSAESGLRNKFGWYLQSYIEDAEGRLRLQTHQEQQACMGCHSNLGVTVDQTFAFARKMPGHDGWRYQDLRGIPDVPQLGHDKPVFLTYLERVGGGDEFRENQELLERFMIDGQLDEQAVRRAAPGGDKDFAWLVLPSRERALDLNRAYIALAREQSFDRGRDAVLKPARRVLAQVENESTGLEKAGRVYRDGQLRLAWSYSVP